MKDLTEEQKQAIINEHPDGIWIVLAEEYPQAQTTTADLLGTDDGVDGQGHGRT
ncbi:MAG: hypothetical protein KIT09_16260 [Bryobacteraceae bacterium]|nr:hypothetical protein [Bryobacteraceae bacterium]